MVKSSLAETNRNKMRASEMIKQSTDNIYKHKHEVWANEKANRDYRNAETTWHNQNQKNEHQALKEANEKRIQELGEFEKNMIEKLQKTMATKDNALKELGKKSPALKKVQNPRQAYKYKSPERADEEQ